MAYPTGVNFIHTEAPIGAQPIHETETTQKHALGLVVAAKDHTYGEGRFIYLKGVASTAQGDLVVYDVKAGTTVRAVGGGATSTGPVAVAMSANVASQYGWYQIEGSTPVKAATAAADAAVWLTATASQVDDTSAGGASIDGMIFRAATSGGYATCELARPCIRGTTEAGSNSGDVTLGAVGSSANANGATLTGQVLNLEPCSSTMPGVVTTGSQTMAGTKTFSSAPICSAATTSLTVAATIACSGYADGTGTAGNQTLNAPMGKVKIATGASSVVITNSLVLSGSIVNAWIQQATTDATLTHLLRVAVDTGNFTVVGNGNATADVVIAFTIVNR